MDKSKPVVPCGTAILVTCRIGKAIYVLMGKRKGAHGAGEYSVPGGRLEPGEDGRGCAIRELEEETGIKLTRRQVSQFVPVPYTIAMPGGEPWVTLFFVAAVSDPPPMPRTVEPDKCCGWDYYNWKNPPQPLFGALVELFECVKHVDIQQVHHILTISEEA